MILGSPGSAEVQCRNEEQCHNAGVRRRLSQIAQRAGAGATRLLRSDPIAAPSEAAPEPAEDAPIGAGCGLDAGIATRGPRAAAVFAASGRDTSRPGRGCTVVVADSPDLLEGLRPGVAGVSLAELAPTASVPAFDAGTLNPVGWKPVHDTGPATLPAGAEGGAEVAAIRRAHHVEDWTGAQTDPAVRAGELAAAAATGAVVLVAHTDPELESHLGSELYGLMTDSPRITGADGHQRELLSVAMRRAALRRHSLSARARQVLSAAGVDGSGPPLVSVLVPTRRPDQLPNVVDSIRRQAYPRVEVVLALHGDGFDSTAVEAQLDRLNRPARAVHIAADRVFGEVLNAGLAASEGELIAEFDDDDIYGPEHLWDLVLALEYSGAALVGKASEYVYLAGADRTVRRFVGLGERYIDPERYGIAGPTVLVPRQTLDAIGGWRPIGLGADRTLTQDVGAHGGKVYRTHGSGFVLMRHGTGHTWETDELYFLEQAQDERDGCDLRFAGVI